MHPRIIILTLINSIVAKGSPTYHTHNHTQDDYILQLRKNKRLTNVAIAKKFNPNNAHKRHNQYSIHNRVIVAIVVVALCLVSIIFTR